MEIELCRGYIGIMERKMETTIVYWACIGIMEKNMETTISYSILAKEILGAHLADRTCNSATHSF